MKNGPDAGMIQGFGMQGTGMANQFSVMMGDGPIKNWGGSGTIDFTGNGMGVEDLDEKFKYKRYACSACPLGCGAAYDVKDGSYPVGKTHRPEYETVGAFGGMLLNEEHEVVLMCNEICNRFGIDTISTGATIAWAMECYENGVLSAEDTGGLELKWGNGPAIVALTREIAENRGFGKLLANGSRNAARTLNRGFEYLVEVRGIELPMHDPKFTPGYARTYQVDPTPARHVKPGMWYIQQMGMDIKQKYQFKGSRAAHKKASLVL